MIATHLTELVAQLHAGTDPVMVARQLTAHAEAVAALQRDYVKLLSAARAVVERTKGSVDELVALANQVERRPVLPVDPV